MLLKLARLAKIRSPESYSDGRPSAAEVRRQLERILASKTFAKRERLKRFLRYTVEEALSGRGTQINEYLLGVEVFDKDETFDPRLNPVVRVEAHRLRLQLEAYYRQEGAADQLILEVLKGGYCPVWRRAGDEKQGSPARKCWPASALENVSWKLVVLVTGAVVASLWLSSWIIRQPFPVLAGRSSAGLWPPPTSVAVLPFLDLSQDKKLEYLADVLTDELIGSLAVQEKVRVVSRTSVFAFKNRSEDPRRIGRLLNVGTILEGSVRKSGDGLRVTVSLINAHDGYHIWSHTVESGSDDVLALKDEIVAGVCKQLGIRPGSAQASRLPNRSAYRLYLTGRYHWNKRTAEHLRKAISCFERAIAVDPVWPQAYVGLAETYCVLPSYGVASPWEAFPRARTCALKALERSPSLAEAHAPLGYVRFVFDWNWREAEGAFRRALELNPNYPTARQWYAGFLRAMGRFEEAIREIDRAQDLDPLSPVIGTEKGAIYRVMRRHQDAIEQHRRVIDFEPDCPVAYLHLGMDYAAVGSYSEAIEAFRQAGRLSEQEPAEAVAWLGYCYGRKGLVREVREALGRLEAMGQRRYVPQVLFALVHLGSGDKQRAFEYLEKAWAVRDSALVGWLPCEPVFDAVRREERFRALLRRVGFPEPL